MVWSGVLEGEIMQSFRQMEVLMLFLMNGLQRPRDRDSHLSCQQLHILGFNLLTCSSSEKTGREDLHYFKKI